MTDVAVPERERALFGVWKRVNELADQEDTFAIRALIAEAGINDLMHIGVPSDQFTPAMIAEWVLGNWANVIDGGHLWMLNSARNVSQHQYDKLMAELGDDSEPHD